MFDYVMNPPVPGQLPAHLNHRWLRALYLMTKGRKPSKRYDDRATHRSYVYQHATQPRGRRFRWTAAQDLPDVHEAEAVRLRWESWRRVELHARVLAGESDGRIADRTGLTPEGVRAYHDLHFDVRPYLGKTSYIAEMALPSCVGMGPYLDGPILLLLGYSLGGDTVDKLKAFFVRRGGVRAVNRPSPTGSTNGGSGSSRWPRTHSASRPARTPPRTLSGSSALLGTWILTGYRHYLRGVGRPRRSSRRPSVSARPT
jgi:hypothetical protein